MVDLLRRFRRWCSWKRVRASLWLALLVAVSSVPVLIGVRDAPGWGRFGPLLIGLLAAAGLAWVLRRREDLVTPEARLADFTGRQAPAPNDIVCLFQNFYGIDLASVAIDRAADRILFERCHAPRRWPFTWNERSYACGVSEIEGFVLPRRTSGDPKDRLYPLVVITPRGRAEIPADADSVAALVTFLESRFEPQPRAVVDGPDSLNAVVGGACVGMAAGVASALTAKVSDATFAWWFIGGAFAGAFLTRTVLNLADRLFGIDLGGPIGGAVKGALIAGQGTLPLLIFTLQGWEWAWGWLLPLAISVGALLGTVWGTRRSGIATSSMGLPLATFAERVGSLTGSEGASRGRERIATLLAAQWTRRGADPQAYVGDLLYEAVRAAHADQRGGAWQPEVDVFDGEVRVGCTWEPGGPAGHTADEPAATKELLQGVADFASVLGQSPQPPWRLDVEFEAPAGVAALLGSIHPDPHVCRQVGIDRTGGFSIRIRAVPPSPAAQPLPPLAEVLRAESTLDAIGSEDTNGKRLQAPTTS